MAKLVLPPDTTFDFSEWEWGNILDEAKSLVSDVENAVLNTVEDDLECMLSLEDGKVIFAIGLPFVEPGDWVFAGVDFDELVAEIAEPNAWDDEGKKEVAAIFRKWADVLDAPVKSTNPA